MTDGHTDESAARETVIDVAATEIPPERSATETPSSRGRGGVIASLVVLVIVVLALVGTSPYWAPSLAPVLPWTPRGTDTVAAQQAELRQQLTEMQQGLDELARQQQQQQQQPAPDEAAVKAQQATLQALTARVTALEARPTGDPQSAAAIAALKNDFARLDGEVKDDAARLARLEEARGQGARAADRELLLAIGDLRSALATSSPFAGQLATVAALAHGQQDVAAALEPLQTAAATGLPSTALLAQRFDDQVAPAILRARTGEAQNAPQSSGWGQRALDALGSLVVVRRIDQGKVDATSHPVDAAVETAQAALKKGDLAGAVKTLSSLDGAPAQAAASWLAEAKQRLAAEAAIAHLTEMVTARLASAGTAPASTSAADPSR